MYPTIEEVNAADHYQLCEWYRFIRAPENKDESTVNSRILERFYEHGGFTVEMSKHIGWKK